MVDITRARLNAVFLLDIEDLETLLDADASSAKPSSPSPPLLPLRACRIYPLLLSSHSRIYDPSRTRPAPKLPEVGYPFFPSCFSSLSLERPSNNLSLPALSTPLPTTPNDCHESHSSIRSSRLLWTSTPCRPPQREPFYFLAFCSTFF